MIEQQTDRLLPRSSLADLLSEAALAKRWQITPRTLQRRRRAGLAPRFLKVGRRIFYRLADIEGFEAERMVGTGDGE